MTVEILLRSENKFHDVGVHGLNLARPTSQNRLIYSPSLTMIIIIYNNN